MRVAGIAVECVVAVAATLKGCSRSARWTLLTGAVATFGRCSAGSQALRNGYPAEQVPATGSPEVPDRNNRSLLAAASEVTECFAARN